MCCLSLVSFSGEIPLAIFIDLSKAFDCLNHNVLLKKLQHYGFSNLALNLLSNRQQFVKSSEYTSNLQNITTGVPQGSILGPLLFLIYMNDFAYASKHFAMINFADDTALLSTLQSNATLSSNETNSELSKISNWLRANKLLMNVNKTKAMVFHSAKKKVQNPIIELNRTKIEIVNHFTYLGIVLDRHLSWNEHIKAIASKISKTTGVLNRLKNFLPKCTLKLIYDSLINCRIKYGILLWGACPGIKRILLLQKRAVRAIAKAKYNAHCNPIFKSIEILKIEDERKLQELIVYYKYKHNILPHYFQNNFITNISSNSQRQTRNSSYILYPRFRHEFVRKQLRYSLAKTVNETPQYCLEKIHTHSLKGYAR